MQTISQKMAHELEPDTLLLSTPVTGSSSSRRLRSAQCAHRKPTVHSKPEKSSYQFRQHSTVKSHFTHPPRIQAAFRKKQWNRLLQQDDLHFRPALVANCRAVRCSRRRGRTYHVHSGYKHPRRRAMVDQLFYCR